MRDLWLVAQGTVGCKRLLEFGPAEERCTAGCAGLDERYDGSMLHPRAVESYQVMTLVELHSNPAVPKSATNHLRSPTAPTEFLTHIDIFIFPKCTSRSLTSCSATMHVHVVLAAGSKVDWRVEGMAHTQCSARRLLQSSNTKIVTVDPVFFHRHLSTVAMDAWLQQLLSDCMAPQIGQGIARCRCNEARHLLS